MIDDGQQTDAEAVLDGTVVADPALDDTVKADDQPIDVTAADESDEYGDIDLGDGMTIQENEEDTEVKEAA